MYMAIAHEYKPLQTSHQRYALLEW